MSLSLGTEEWGSSSRLSLTSAGLSPTGGKARGGVPTPGKQGTGLALNWHPAQSSLAGAL